MVAWKMNGIYKADPNSVADELNSLGEKYTPEDVVNFARNEETELHKCFLWDDTEAAEKYRIIQAQQVIRFIVYVDDKKEEPEKTNIRYFVSTGERESTYTPIKLVVENKDEYQKILDRAFAELRAFKEKYKNLKELDYIIELID